ncbi:arginase family protein [Microthyrium microscopicum]|uniref:Arginase family protein n=1 Tax=Microthyrium microscopicum TaxID=703497 RepID=A0A6A6UNP9_9PEZI|nr:arginase family protein [Microthyrium microscopicum]
MRYYTNNMTAYVLCKSPLIAILVFAIVACCFQQPVVLPKNQNFIERSIFRFQPDIFSILSQPEQHAYDDFTEDIPYEGIAYFAHLNGTNCFSPASDGEFDIGIVGAPFDLGVTYRPGARFGPAGTRMGSRRLSPSMAYSMDHIVNKSSINPFKDWATVVDCGDIKNTPFDKLQAIHELQKGWEAIASRKVRNAKKAQSPRIISIGGDHTISLPAIRALHETWGRVSVLHFDSHLDSWDPKQLGGGHSKYSQISHGSMFHLLHEEGLLADKNMHLGSRSMLFQSNFDLDHDAACGFSYIRAREIDIIGVKGVVDKIVKTVGDKFVYLSIDIDVLDPAFAPATGTIEPGGWTTRELLRILDGLSKAGLKIVGSDVVEFTPVYDNNAETTAIAVTEIIYEILQWMIRVPVSRG